MANEADIVGATIAGKYRVRRVLGGGSMGMVCEAEHLEIGKRVAIKLIDASLTGMTDIAMRFRQEARATSLVESQHIVQVFDVGTDERLGLYLVMEYLAGEDLAKVLARERQLSIRTAVRVGVQVARGLSKAHEAGVVHRDLKPANIFLCASEDDEPLVKILDFGISKVVDSSRTGSAPVLKLTRDGAVVGTPQYMSPEQAQGLPIDERSDVWALGLVLYEMLAGRPAYRELPTYEQFIVHLVSKPPDPLRESAPWVPDDLASVVHGAIEHDLTKRIPNCAELVRRLIEAHPIHAGRELGSPVSETTDTWSDPRSFDRDDPSTARHRGRDRPDSGDGERSRRAVRSGPSRHGSLASSGVRGTATSTEPPLEDFEEDAPQFFDRKLLQTFDRPAADPLKPIDSPPEGGGHAKSSEPSRPGAGRRFQHGLAGLALLVLGLVVAAVLAWR